MTTALSNVLVIRSSVTGAASVSNALIDGFLADLAAAKPAAKVVSRDLDAAPVDHVHAQTLAGIGRPAPETPAAVPTRALSDDLIGEVQAADTIVIGAPMYNFSISSLLKAWFDHVLRAGATFRYTAEGPEGLLTGRRAVIVATRAGAYSEGAGAAMDFHVPYLKTLLGFVGITDVQVVLVEGLAFGAEAAEAAKANGAAQLKAIAEAA